MAYLPHFSNEVILLKHAMVTHNDTILCADCLELINATAMEAQFLPAFDENTDETSTSSTAIAVSISGLLVLLIGLGVFVFHSYYRNNTVSGDSSKGMYKILLLLYAYTQNMLT